jgi:site-specific recombinase XerD
MLTMADVLLAIDSSDAEVAMTMTELLRRYVEKSKAPNTLRAYDSDLRHYQRWCHAHHASWLPAAPQTVAGYLAGLASTGIKPSTVRRRLSAIAEVHRLTRVPSPAADELVRLAMAGIRRQHGSAPTQKAALTTDELSLLLATTSPVSAAGSRDRAVLLLGFAGGFRRSELVALDIDDIDEVAQGLRVLIRRSTTDQEGDGRELGIPWGERTGTCPVRAYQSWRATGRIASGAVFRPVDRHDRVGGNRLTDRAVARIIQRAAQRAGLDPHRYAGHSLRAGLATAATAAGAPERGIMAQTGHRSVTALRGYIRRGTLFEENAAGYLGL